MKHTKNIVYSLALGTVLLGCSGGGSSSSDETLDTQSTYILSGTVPGTIIEAYCSNGSYYSTNSVNNGTANHPFSLQLPSNLDCKIVMITNETDSNTSNYIITPIKFSTTSNTGTYLSMYKNVDLGYVNLETISSGGTPGVKAPHTVSLGDDSIEIKSLSNDSMDSNNDGIPNIYEDDDGDGKTNKYDDEVDTNDHDHDGIDDRYDVDYNNDGDHENDNSTSTTISLPSNFTANSGRLLGSQCAQCHGTNGISSSSFDSIKGESGLYNEMREDGGIMYEQALGYTQSEANAIESWLNSF